MKRIINLFLVFVLSLTFLCGCGKSETEQDSKYKQCISLNGSETCDIKVFPSYYSGSSIMVAASTLKRDSRCVDAWEDDNGDLIIRYDKDTLEKEYNRCFDLLLKELNTYNELPIKLVVSEDYSKLTYYINDETKHKDILGTAIIMAPLMCQNLQLLCGVERDNVNVVYDIVYEPNGKVVMSFEYGKDYNFTFEEWQQKLQDAKE